MQAGDSNTDKMRIDDIGAMVIVIFCLVLIAVGKDSETVKAVLFTVIGKMFGKYQNKEPRRRVS